MQTYIRIRLCFILYSFQVQQYMDSDKHRWHVDSELNTGVVFGIIPAWYSSDRRG